MGNGGLLSAPISANQSMLLMNVILFCVCCTSCSGIIAGFHVLDAETGGRVELNMQTNADPCSKIGIGHR